MITKQQILDAMMEHMTSAYDNGNINDGGIHGGEEAADAILNLLQADVIKSVCPHCGSKSWLMNDKGIYNCNDCNGQWQTVL